METLYAVSLGKMTGSATKKECCRGAQAVEGNRGGLRSSDAR